MSKRSTVWENSVVAPPRGERGLKWVSLPKLFALCYRSPSWGAWIEIRIDCLYWSPYHVAPPRGERGLKYLYSVELIQHLLSLPLVGSVD